MDRKKELKMQYKQMKPEMGVFIIRSNVENKYYLQGTQNLKGVMNSTKFKLYAGNHPNRELQKAWMELGKDSFSIEILEKLEYGKDESKTDYTDDLAVLEMVWEEKLAREGLVPYMK